MKICVATLLSIAFILGKSVKLRASVTRQVLSDGDGPASPVCQQCCQGPAAIPGIPGLPGPAGPMGPYGQLGSKGEAGQQGLKGEIGQIGQIGPMGEQGAPGNTGSKGNDGIGLPGKKGPRGPPGLDGATGETGVKGQKGEPGETPDDSNQRVAFTVVRTSPSDSSSNHDTRLPFQETKTLLPGTSFDLDTGTFTCNASGTYTFTFSVLNYSNSGYLYIHLVKNDYKVISAFSNSNQLGQVSGSAAMALQRGDTVYVTMKGKAHGDPTYHWTSFSGVLLYPE